MSEHNDVTESRAARSQAEEEAAQAAVDRVRSWHAGSTPEIIAEELRTALQKVEVSRDDAWVQRHADEISTADPLQS
jgi:hypothetical protein